MTKNIPSTALKGRQYVSPGRSFALRSAGLGTSPILTKSTVAPTRLKSTPALGATLLEKAKKYCLVDFSPSAFPLFLDEDLRAKNELVEGVLRPRFIGAKSEVRSARGKYLMSPRPFQKLVKK